MESSLREKKLNMLYHRIGLLHNLSKEEVRKIVESPYAFAKEKINDLDVKGIASEEEFNNTKTNFIFKYLGKLHTNYKTIKGRKKQSDTFIQINKDKWEK
jgi:hypothetical protein